jgi:hypothetical protein
MDSFVKALRKFFYYVGDTVAHSNQIKGAISGPCQTGTGVGLELNPTVAWEETKRVGPCPDRRTAFQWPSQEDVRNAQQVDDIEPEG